jgi:hypothetical protein
MKVKLSNVKPNPFRNVDVYPIDRVKVEQLKKSINSTMFWDNILARDAGDGAIQIAYGHHRVQALREIYSPDDEFNFIIKDLDDAAMIRIMADENMKDWNHDSAIERETIRAIVKAAGDGRIGLPKAFSREDQMRYAPSFCLGKQAVMALCAQSGLIINQPYTADSIVGFLGGTMSINTVKYTLQALCFIEKGKIKEDQLAGLTSAQARTVIEETSRAIKQAEAIRKTAEREALSAPTPIIEQKIKQEAKKTADAIVKSTTKAVSNTIKSGGTTIDAKRKGIEARSVVQPQVKELPEINEAASRVASQLMRLLDPDYDPGKKLTDLIKFKQHLSPTSLQNISRALDVVIEYAEGYRSSLNKID